MRGYTLSHVLVRRYYVEIRSLSLRIDAHVRVVSRHAYMAT